MGQADYMAASINAALCVHAHLLLMQPSSQWAAARLQARDQGLKTPVIWDTLSLMLVATVPNRITLDTGPEDVAIPALCSDKILDLLK